VAHPQTRRLLTLIVVLTLLLAMSLAADPVFGRPDTTCMHRPSGFWPLPAECNSPFE
jgi:hypothetical protein